MRRLIVGCRAPRLRAALWEVLEGVPVPAAAHGQGVVLSDLEAEVAAIPRLRQRCELLWACRAHLDGFADRGLD